MTTFCIALYESYLSTPPGDPSDQLLIIRSGVKKGHNKYFVHINLDRVPWVQVPCLKEVSIKSRKSLVLTQVRVCQHLLCSSYAVMKNLSTKDIIVVAQKKQLRRHKISDPNPERGKHLSPSISYSLPIDSCSNILWRRNVYSSTRPLQLFEKFKFTLKLFLASMANYFFLWANFNLIGYTEKNVVAYGEKIM